MSNVKYQMSKKGFTLIEMLIVIAIISILASAILVGFRGFIGSAYDSRRTTDLKNVQSYLQIYYVKNRAYPAGDGGTGSWGDGRTGGLSGALIGANIGATKIPIDPLAGSGYVYYYGSGSGYNSLGQACTDQMYTLGAMLSTTDNSSLQEDIDGYSCNIDCSDPVYCSEY